MIHVNFVMTVKKEWFFSEIVDEKLKDYVSRIDEKNTDKESQNVCELVEKRTEQVKVLKKSNKNILSRFNERCVTT